MTCEHVLLRAKEYNFGRSMETGYHDCGVIYTCADCGEVFDDDDMARERAACAPEVAA